MTRLITILFLAVSLSAGAQGVHESRTFKVREHAFPAVLILASGAFEGVMDHLQFHYDKPDQFWNPDLSWRNKYRNHDPQQGRTFAGKYMVWTTDGWHAMKFGRNLSMFAGFAIHINKTGVKKRWYVYILEGVSYWAINRAGFTLTYNLLPR